MTADVYRFPGTDDRLVSMAIAPADARALVDLAIKRADNLARLIRKAAPAPEITAAAEAVAALREQLASLQLTTSVFDAIWNAALRPGRKAPETAVPATRAQLRAVPGGKRTPGGAA